MTTTVRIGTFTNPVVLEVARAIGALESAGLVVESAPVPSSPSQFRSLAAGEFDAIFTNPDNALAYRFVPDNPLGTLLDIEVTAAIDRGLGLTLCSAPGVELLGPGARLGVDAATSGFALLGYALLERVGLSVGDIAIETAGTTPARAAALLAGSCDVTMLNAGNELHALDRGCTALGSVADIGPYLGTVIVRRSSGDPGPTDELARVLTQVAASIVHGELADEALAATSTALGLSPALAHQHLAVLRDPVHGLVADGQVDAASIETALDVRERYLPSAALDTARAEWRGMLATR